MNKSPRDFSQLSPINIQKSIERANKTLSPNTTTFYGEKWMKNFEFVYFYVPCDVFVYWNMIGISILVEMERISKMAIVSSMS